MWDKQEEIHKFLSRGRAEVGKMEKMQYCPNQAKLLFILSTWNVLFITDYMKLDYLVCIQNAHSMFSKLIEGWSQSQFSELYSLVRA